MNVDVLILMGSDSDLPTMQSALDTLKKFGVTCEISVSSAALTASSKKRKKAAPKPLSVPPAVRRIWPVWSPR